MVFIWVVNMLGFILLPLSDETFEIAGVELPTLAIFAATSTISVTLALALMTFVFTHVEGIRQRRGRLLQELDPRRAQGDAAADHPARDPGSVHAAHQPVGQALREHAGRAHADPQGSSAWIFVIGNIGLAVVAVLAATAFYLFEVVIVVSIQAYIFAASVRHLHRLGDRA